MLDHRIAPDAQNIFSFLVAVLSFEDFDARRASIALATGAQSLAVDATDRRVLAHTFRQLASELERDAAADAVGQVN